MHVNPKPSSSFSTHSFFPFTPPPLPSNYPFHLPPSTITFEFFMSSYNFRPDEGKKKVTTISRLEIANYEHLFIQNWMRFLG